MSKYYEEAPLNYGDTPGSTDDEYFGSGWSVRREGGLFYFCFISGNLQGERRKVRISKDDFEEIRQGGMSFDEICRKYEVH